jgi:hypothetical protein
MNLLYVKAMEAFQKDAEREKSANFKSESQDEKRRK